MPKVTKQKNGRYQRSVVVGKDENGKPVRKFFTGRTIKEVDEQVAAFKREQAESAVDEQPEAVPDMTFAQMGELWLAEYKRAVSLTGRKRYAVVLKTHLNPTIGNVLLRDLKPLHIKKIINGLAEKGYAEKTIMEIKQTAVQVLDAAVENDYLHRNVFAKAKVPKTGKTTRRPIREQEKKLILEHYAGHRMGVPALLLLLYTGLRKGELVALEWSDIDLDAALLSVNKSAWFNNNRVAVKIPKTDAGFRDIPIPALILPIVREAKEKATSEFVCPAATGKRMTHTAYNAAWESYLGYLNLKAGGRRGSRSRPPLIVIEEFTAHQLRHTYSTMLYDAGVDPKSAQKFLGHADLQVTLKIYTHLSEEKERGAVDALNRFLGGDAGGNADGGGESATQGGVEANGEDGSPSAP